MITLFCICVDSFHHKILKNISIIWNYNILYFFFYFKDCMMDYACDKDTILPVFVTRMESKDKINSDIKKKKNPTYSCTHKHIFTSNYCHLNVSMKYFN
jgi:hypothetical protein